MITKEIAMSLNWRNVLEHTTLVSPKTGKPYTCRVNGKCKVWKTKPEKFRLPVKRGFHIFFYITEENAGDWRKEEVNEAVTDSSTS